MRHEITINAAKDTTQQRIEQLEHWLYSHLRDKNCHRAPTFSPDNMPPRTDSCVEDDEDVAVGSSHEMKDRDRRHAEQIEKHAVAEQKAEHENRRLREEVRCLRDYIAKIKDVATYAERSMP